MIRTIIEVAGFPKDYVEQITSKILERIKKENGIEVTKESVNEAKLVKEKFYSAFLELELKINNFLKLNHFCFNYLPSTIEILDTEKISVPARELTNALNDLLSKLHQYNLAVTNLNARLKSFQKQQQQPKEQTPSQ